ncbi:VOC family protein [Aidingimonas halophila]|uniref:VOC domain-containing protein n=1 Tax=Aidingimonas halophila TaxID=574349 RepID=A0A1H3GVD2_9GAMM|nr:hypothetical protein [Aidingimonas halophila]GHC35900.1 hypothetical protein GCM10008094_31380 [Aidingimonas halophila]SDY06299.1 hypothetical protein SAMN05443545_11044 [Aidingimonas halophila]
MNAVAYFEIQATNPEAAMHCYRDVFGWEFEKQAGLPIPYWRIDTEGIHGGLLERPVPTPPAECGTNFNAERLIAHGPAGSDNGLR